MNRSTLYLEQKLKTASACVGRCRGWRSLLVIFIFAVVSCTQAEDDTLIDRSFLTKQPCAPPCWYGLELDRSDRDEIYAALKQLPFIDQASIKETTGLVWLGDENAKEIYWGCLHPSDKSCGGARLADGKLKLIWFTVGFDLTFQAVVDQLGFPDYVDYGVYHPEAGGCQITLNWPELGIAVDSLNKSSDAECQAIANSEGLSADTKVRTLYYSVREVFGTEPGGCCTRISWPGFSQP